MVVTVASAVGAAVVTVVSGARVVITVVSSSGVIVVSADVVFVGTVVA